MRSAAWALAIGLFGAQAFGAVVGTVTDPAGRPIAGAEVWIVDQPQSAGPAAVSDARGGFSLPAVQRGEIVRVEVCHEGFQSAEEGLFGPQDGPVHWTLEPAGRFTGVITRPDGAPAADATVSLGGLGGFLSDDLMRCPTTSQVQTDNVGRYTIDGIAPGLYHLSAEIRGLAGIHSKTVPLHAGETVEVDVTLSRGASLAGRVLGPDGAPVGGATVTAVLGWPEQSGTTDKAGRYRLDGVAVGSMEVTVEAEGLKTFQRTIDVQKDGNTLDVTLEQEPEDRSEGHPEGEGRAGRIWAEETSALPDPSVRPSLQDDSRGTERAQPSPPSRAGDLPFGTLRGRIVGPAVGEVLVVEHEAPEGVFFEGWDWPVSPDNTFEGDHLPPGIWTLRAMAEGTSAESFRYALGIVEIPAEGGTIDYDLDFEYGDLTLTVRLPRPGRAAKAQIYHVDGGAEALAPLVDGAVRFDRLQAGDYQIEVQDEDGKTLAEEEVPVAGDAEVTIDLGNGS
jgi:hypothetical protein